MTLGVSNEVWIVAFGVVIFNALLALLINILTARSAYKKGYQAAQIANEALALGRLMEESRERYYAGEEVAQMLAEGDTEGLKQHPNTRD